MVLSMSALATAVLSLVAGDWYTGLWSKLPPAPSQPDAERFSCRPFLPSLFEQTPPSAAHPAIRDGVKAIDEFFSSRFAEGDIDSLSVAVVTSAGALYEQNFGTVRANETDGPPTTSDAQYRLASVSKLFTVLEGLVLEQRGALSWDDPVQKHLKDFTYRPDGLSPKNKGLAPEHAPITLLQLASHMSGLGRDWPAGIAKEWPYDATGGGPPPDNGHPYPTHEAMYKAVKKHHLVSPPWSYPSYSNTGMGILGMALSAASRVADGNQSRISFADLMKRDVFEPMGLNGSHFLATAENRHLVVVPSIAQEYVDQDFLDAMNPAGGQFSSLSDLIKVTQMILNPARPDSLITSYSRDKWLRPVHAFEEDDWTEVGLAWEIIKRADSHGRLRKIYWKRASSRSPSAAAAVRHIALRNRTGSRVFFSFFPAVGELVGWHSAVAVQPGTGYGIIVLMSGRYPDAAKLMYHAFALMQPAIDRALEDAARDLYAGSWVDAGKGTEEATTARIAVERGTLYIEEFRLLGVDVLHGSFGAHDRLALRPSGWRDEFRIETGIPYYNGQEHMGCFPYWAGRDSWGVRNNAAVNAIYFAGEGADRELHVPSLDLVLKRA
ncbi:hypothetical protein BN946_scf184943.g51 [Trametes cinnabarina]|uniref:Beta-lactamase-related domain-containing protein n=1 Tax=Pycnoporus cinnabarinus TaxID=5643 RepID=A0A060SCR7_PYCCI|nr:hypothetical protein BN946_scf184943.g51 [Trametes cinnabarina]